MGGGAWLAGIRRRSAKRPGAHCVATLPNPNGWLAIRGGADLSLILGDEAF